MQQSDSIIHIHPTYSLSDSFFLSMSVCSVVSNSVTLWTVAHQTPLSMGFFRQEYRSGLPVPFPGDLLNPGDEPVSPVSPCIGRQILYHWATWQALFILIGYYKYWVWLPVLYSRSLLVIYFISSSVLMLRRARQSTPVFLPGESHGQWSLVGYSPQDCRELDMTEVT